MVDMTKYKVEVNREKCISTGSCYSLDPLHFDMGEAQKSKVVGGETSDSKSTGEFDDDKISSAQQAAQACPVQAITIQKE
jgi:ferredoxin